jgi:hypothetical protein
VGARTVVTAREGGGGGTAAPTIDPTASAALTWSFLARRRWVLVAPRLGLAWTNLVALALA